MRPRLRVVPLLLVLVLVLVRIEAGSTFPAPFTRTLQATEPAMEGNDVTLAQHLLKRSPFVKSVPLGGVFDNETVTATRMFQRGHGRPVTGEVDADIAALLLALHTDDGYVDDGTPVQELGFKYKVVIPVHRNRSLLATATLRDGRNKILHQMTCLLHGQDGPDGKALNQFTNSGETPTGLASFDLNSPEGDPATYGPYPVNRAVQGTKGNAQFLYPQIRNGILMHTGEWNSTVIPYSHGCIHCYPEDIRKVWKALVEIGVEVRPNTFGKLPYPYAPQGLLSIFQIDK